MDLKVDAVKKDADAKVEKIFISDGKMNTTLTYTAVMAEKMLLKSLNSPKLGSGNSLSLYQEVDGQWKKLSLNPDGTVQKTPCP